jgi:hypothetical protein
VVAVVVVVVVVAFVFQELVAKVKNDETFAIVDVVAIVIDGRSDGTILGASDGMRLGASDGTRLGASDGTRLGASDGTSDGKSENDVVSKPAAAASNWTMSGRLVSPAVSWLVVAVCRLRSLLRRRAPRPLFLSSFVSSAMDVSVGAAVTSDGARLGSSLTIMMAKCGGHVLLVVVVVEVEKGERLGKSERT